MSAPSDAPNTDTSTAWSFPMRGRNTFTWTYDTDRERLLSLYQKGKDKQWDSTKRIDWSLEVDPFDVLGTPENTLALYGSRQYSRLDKRAKQELRRHMAAWEFSQFLHGEQGAMICSARIVESVPDIDAKFYAATQVMDEARHAELFTRFVHDKIGMSYPISPHLKSLLGEALNDSRWDMPYLGMQVLIEGLALAAFGILRDKTDKPLPKQILSYIMQDEARHVAFGRLALRDYYKELTSKELADREDFIVEGCYLMRDRLRMQEVWETLGFDMKECMEYMNRGPRMRAFRSRLFTRIVPCVKDIGLWGPKVQQAYADMGVLEMADRDLLKLMEADEAQAEALDAERCDREVCSPAVTASRRCRSGSCTSATP
ncbi:ferritin-like domain-containing protein [Streptomyces sp. NPDC015345]|uniref:ferritin-like domain-containing protein n=1 Tax=Streptomyces sp. NPDC015345 TaxID=3364953 RepID=UPI0036FE78F7